MGNMRKLMDLGGSWVYRCKDPESWTGLFGDPNMKLAVGPPVGVSFECPCEECGGHRISIPFEGTPPEFNWMVDKIAWGRTGETLDSLTINPSIDCSGTPSCSFHGWIKNGEVTW